MKKIVTLLCICLSFWIMGSNAYSAELMGIDIHGFISQGYLKSTDYNYNADTEDGTFQFNELGINFGKSLTDKLHVGLQLFSRDLGDTGDNEITLDWAYADYRAKDWLGFRAGKIKMPQGLYNETRDVDALRTWIFLPASVYPETLRDLNLALMGVGFYGNVDMGALGGLSYQAMGGIVDVDDDDARLAYHLRGATQNLTNLESTDITVDSRYAMALVWDSPLEGLRLGGSFNQAKLSADAVTEISGPMGDASITIATKFNYIRNSVASIEYTWNDLLLVAEYIVTMYDYKDDNGNSIENNHLDSDGWYLGAAYRFTDWFELGGYYSHQYNNTDDRDGDSNRDYDPSHRAWLQDLCLTTRFDINEYISLKLEGHALKGTSVLFPLENLPGDNEEWFDEGEDWYMFAAKVTYTF